MNDNDYSPDEPVATGSVRTELRGDVDAAQAYVRTARRMLGTMRTLLGVNERIAAGEAGGYYHHTRQLDDGTYIEVLTNNGTDTIRITSPRPIPTSGTEGQAIDHASTIDNAATQRQHREEPPTGMPEVERSSKKAEEAEEGEGPVDDYEPYLWIGARVLNPWPGDFQQLLHVCVWEIPDEKGKEPVILSNRNEFVSESETMYADYPLGPWKQFIDDDKTTGVAYTDDKLFMLLRANKLSMRPPEADESEPEYDVVFISDPDNDLELDTKKHGPMEGKSTGGQYLVKVMHVGADCGPTRTYAPQVELRIITGKGSYVSDTRHNFTIPEGTGYRMGILPKGWFLHEYEKEPDPTGCIYCNAEADDRGPNPHAPHWWQGMATVNIAPAQTQVPVNELELSTTDYTDEVALPPTGFEPGGWLSHIDRCPACQGWQIRYYGIGTGTTFWTDSGWQWFDYSSEFYDQRERLEFWHARIYELCSWGHGDIIEWLKDAGITSATFRCYDSGAFIDLQLRLNEPIENCNSHLIEDARIDMGMVRDYDGNPVGFGLECFAEGFDWFAWMEANLPAPWRREDAAAFFAVLEHHDKTGALVSRTVTPISYEEYMAVGNEMYPGSPGKLKAQCIKVASDE